MSYACPSEAPIAIGVGGSYEFGVGVGAGAGAGVNNVSIFGEMVIDGDHGSFFGQPHDN